MGAVGVELKEETIVVDGVEIRIAEDDGDLTPEDLQALAEQHAGRLPLPPEHVKAIVRVMRAFSGAKVVKR